MSKISAVSPESGSAAAASHRDEPHAGDAVYCMAGAVAETAAPSVGTSRIGSRYGGVDESEGLCELLGARYALFHFQEQVTDSDITFDYRLRPGACLRCAE